MFEARSNTYQWDIQNPAGYANAMGRYKTEKELAFLLAHVPGQRQHILDIGGGSGRFAIPLADRGHDVTLLDLSEDALLLVKKQNRARIATHCGDFLTHAFERQFNVVLGIESVQCFTSVTLEALFTRIHSLLLPGGRFIFTELNNKSWRYRLHALREDKALYNVAAPEAYKTSLRNAGFKLLSMEGFVWMPFTVTSDSQVLPLFKLIERAFHLKRWIAQSPWLLIAAERS